MNNQILYGKVPPQAKEMEDVVLGAILLDKRAFDIVSEILQPECFYSDANQRIFNACRTLAKKNWVIDEITVMEQLRTDKALELIGGPFYITKLTSKLIGSIGGIEEKCRIVLEQYLKRELIRITGELHQLAYEPDSDAFDLLDLSESRIFEISNKHLNNDYTNLSAGLVPVMKRIEELKNSTDHISGIPSGFASLDRTTHGWQDTDLIILAARPSVGKTAFALNLASNACLNHIKPVNVGFFSLEMSTGQLIQRLISKESEVPLDQIRSGKMGDGELKRLYKTIDHPLGNAKLFIDDSSALNIMQLRSKARRMVNKDGVKLIIIDYLQLMSGDARKNGNREQEISQISRELKGLAKDISIPVIALSQLSREVEKRTAKIPQLSDLRESGAIEQDADMVAFLYRPSSDEITDVTNLKICKHRHGKLDEIAFLVNHNIQKWEEPKTEVSRWKPIDGDY